MTVRADTSAIGVDKPLRADAERNRRRIIDAARELFATRGIDITLDEVAAHAKVGVGTVYRRFACKENLIDGVFEQRLEDVLLIAQESLGIDDAWDGLAMLLERVCEGISADRGLNDVLMGTDEGRMGIARMRERIDPFIERIVLRARESGALRADVEVNDFFAIIAMVAAAGLEDPRDIRPFHVDQRVAGPDVQSFAQLYPWMPDGFLMDESVIPKGWRRSWAAANVDHF